MSSAFAVAFYGARYPVAYDELEELETREDQRLHRAQRDGLEAFWARFGDDQTYFLFVGKKLSLMNVENDLTTVYSRRELETHMDEVDAQLFAGDWKGKVGLYLQWGEDT